MKSSTGNEGSVRIMVMCPICRERHESTEIYIEIAGKLCGRCRMRKMGIMT